MRSTCGRDRPGDRAASKRAAPWRRWRRGHASSERRTPAFPRTRYGRWRATTAAVLSDDGHGLPCALFRGVLGSALRFLRGLLLQAFALEVGQIVDEQLALEVIH